MSWQVRSASRQRGLATVEMALVTPVLLIILLVTFEFTRAFYQQNTLTKSVRDAARLLSIDGFKGAIFDLTAADKTKALNLAVYGNVGGTGSPVLPGLTTSKFTVTKKPNVPSGLAMLEHVEVSVAYNFQPLWPVIRNLNFLGGNVNTAFTLNARSTMRALK